MKRRVLLGVGKDYASNASGIIQALAYGHRHLVFTEHDVPIDQQIDLDALLGEDSPKICFDVEGTSHAHFKRQAGFVGAMVSRAGGSTTDMMQLYWEGIILDGERSNYPVTAHNMKISWLDRARFVRCAWIESGAHGLELGVVDPDTPGNASAVVFRDCDFEFNGWSGLVLANTRDYVIHEFCQFRYNSKGGGSHPGLYIHDAAAHLEAGDSEYGFGLIDGNHFPMGAPNVSTFTGIQLGKARRVRVYDNDFDDAQISMTDDTVDCFFGSNIESGGQGVSLFSWKNPENVYEGNVG